MAARRADPLARRALLWSAVFLAVTVVHHLLGGAALLTIPGLDSEHSRFLAHKGSIAAILAALLLAAGLWRRAGLVRPHGIQWLGWAGPLWLPILATLPLALLAAARDPVMALGYCAVAFFVGFAEEAVFRGVIFHAWRARSIWRAALGSSALFGLIHLLGLVGAAEPWLIVAQAPVAFSLGLIFAGLTLNARSLWPAIAFHTAIDAVNFVANGGVANSFQAIEPDTATLLSILGSVLLLTAWGLFLLWRETSKPNQPERTPNP